MENFYDWNAHKRAGTIVFWLSRGEKLTTAEIAKLLNISYWGAMYLMDNLTHTPIGLTVVDGKWQILDD
jgi:DNA-binding CsgD family transcriptional regulator